MTSIRYLSNSTALDFYKSNKENRCYISNVLHQLM